MVWYSLSSQQLWQAKEKALNIFIPEFRSLCTSKKFCLKKRTTLFKSLNWKTLMLKTVCHLHCCSYKLQYPGSEKHSPKIPTGWDGLWVTRFHLRWWWNVTLIWEPFGPVHTVHRSLHVEGRNHRDSAVHEAAACHGSCWVSLHGVMSQCDIWVRMCKTSHLSLSNLVEVGWWWEVIADTVKNNERTWERQVHTKRDFLVRVICCWPQGSLGVITALEAGKGAEMCLSAGGHPWVPGSSPGFQLQDNG